MKSLRLTAVVVALLALGSAPLVAAPSAPAACFLAPQDTIVPPVQPSAVALPFLDKPAPENKVVICGVRCTLCAQSPDFGCLCEGFFCADGTFVCCQPR